jgi:hypothetical protein
MTRVLVLASLLAACGLEPEVGRFERTCAADTRYDPPAGYDAAGPDPRCAPNAATADDDCDRCENENCCATRFGCYDDTVCRCADQAFDECLDNAAEQDGAAFELAQSKCASNFAATGAAAKARVECRERSCATLCRTSRR